MTDLFKEKADNWDTRPIPMQISDGVGTALLAKQPLNADMCVMDFGAGTGLLCAHVAPKVKTVYAVDISSSMLEKLVSKPELQGNVQAVCQNILETPFQHKIELVTSAMALHHVEDTNTLFQTFASLLSSGGRLALADLDSEDGSFHPESIEGVFHKGFDRSQLQQILEKNGFVDIEFTTAVVVKKETKDYPIFLVTATKQ